MTIFFIVIISILIILACSSLKIDIQSFKIINKSIEEIKIVFSLAFFNKINLLKITINKDKLQKIKNNEKVEKLIRKLKKKLLTEYKDMPKVEAKDVIEILKNFKLNDVEIRAFIGTEDAPFTAFTVTLLSLIITFLIARNVKNTKYKVLPIYKGEYFLDLTIKCIISIKLVHIINIRKILKRNVKEEENGRKSNRRSYANSNG